MKSSPMPPRKAPLKRTALKRSTKPPKRRAVSPASAAQREKARDHACIVAGCWEVNCDPAHLIDRSLGGDDDPRAIVPLCRHHHREYDEGRLSLLEHLEPNHRVELAYAVETVGLLRALRRVTNQRWTPEADHA